MLSIRTQDRMALVPYDSIKIEEVGDSYFINLEYDMRSVHLGTYTTKERALEVLDEIEKHVVGRIIIPTQRYERKDYLEMGTSNPYAEVNETKIEKLPTIYQMPKE